MILDRGPIRGRAGERGDLERERVWILWKVAHSSAGTVIAACSSQQLKSGSVL